MMLVNHGAAANCRPAGLSDGLGNLAAIVAADRVFPADDNILAHLEMAGW
jgi:hypothetical protein